MENPLAEAQRNIEQLMQDSLARRAQALPPPPEPLSEDKLARRVQREVGRAIGDFSMIEQGDRILVAVSGGKDSWLLLRVLADLQKIAPVDFELIAVNIDQGYSGFRQDLVAEYLEKHNYTHFMEYFDIAQIVREKSPDATPCSLCSRLRRGSLYGLAEKHRCNKIALGHHLDDFIETLLLNILFTGKMAAMAPKLRADNGQHIVIRPLVYVAERDIRRLVAHWNMPIVCCQCPLMCGEVVHGDFKRRMVKKLIDTLEVGIPDVRRSLLASLSRVNPSHLLDRSLWNFGLGEQ